MIGRIGASGHLPTRAKASLHLVFLEAAFLRVGEMLVLAAAAFGVIGTRRIFAGRAGLKNFHDLRARVMGLPFGDPHPHPLTLGREGHKDHESLLNAGEAVSAKDHLLDRDLDYFPARRQGRGSGGRIGGCHQKETAAGSAAVVSLSPAKGDEQKLSTSSSNRPGDNH